MDSALRHRSLPFVGLHFGFMHL